MIVFWAGYRRTWCPQSTIESSKISYQNATDADCEDFESRTVGFPIKDTAREALSRLKFTVEQHQLSDYGAPMDLCIINHVPTSFDRAHDQSFSQESYETYTDYLNLLDGVKTKNGTIKVIHKENYGFSFSGFNFAYTKYKNDYDYFFFSEDDYVYHSMKPTYLLNEAIDKIGQGLGYAATVYRWKMGTAPRHSVIMGMNGITSKETMEAIGGKLPMQHESYYGWEYDKHEKAEYSLAYVLTRKNVPTYTVGREFIMWRRPASTLAAPAGRVLPWTEDYSR